MFRASLICTRCGALTLGPADAKGDLATKLGEAAHIRSARPGPRYDKNMTDAQRGHSDNGIWLCASCHTLIDKNEDEFPADMLLEWKRKHEEVLRSLLFSHRSILPVLRRFTEEGQIAQDVIDTLESHGALFMDQHLEVEQSVILSIDRLRSDLQLLLRRVRYDSQLKQLIRDLIAECRGFMNHTDRFRQRYWTELEGMRHRAGIIILRLQQDYGCKIRGPLNRILPS